MPGSSNTNHDLSHITMPNGMVFDTSKRLEETLQSILDVLVVRGGRPYFKQAFVLLVDSDSDKSVVAAAQGMPQGFRDAAGLRPEELDRYDLGVTSRVLRSGLSCHETDASRLHEGIMFFGVPIMMRGGVTGVLTAGREGGRPGEIASDLRFLGGMARVLGLCVTCDARCRQCEHSEAELQHELSRLRSRLAARADEHEERQTLNQIQGQSPVMREIRRQVEKVAPTKAAVLLQGEPGTGKTLVAEIIHALSGRSGHPFVKVDCTSIPHDLLEVELFGRDGSQDVELDGEPLIGARQGRLEEAHKGTLFLYEASLLPLPVQAKLLQVLQDKVVKRLGDNPAARSHPADVRIVTASSTDLAALARQEEFRPDLFYRLNVFLIQTPPLRERHEDIPRLLNHFLLNIRESCRRNLAFTPGALKMLTSYHWPGNVREMEELLEQLAVMAETSAIETGMLLPLLARDPDSAVELPPEEGESRVVGRGHTLQDMERNEVVAALRRNDWVQHKGAKDLGITQRQMGYRVRKYKLEGVIAEERAKLRSRKNKS